MKNKLSVIIPVYNVESYLSRCVDSVLMQTFNHLEIILVNDGSTDSSGLICDEFASKDKRVKVIHQKNAGVSAARNAGMQIAIGDYIAFVDSDDWLEQSMYESMMEIAVRENVDVIMCDFFNVKNGCTEKITSDIRKGFYDKKSIVTELYPTLLVTENFGRIPIVSACICLFKKTMFTESKVYFNENLKYSEDYLFMAEIVTKTSSFYYMKGQYFYYYLQNDESRSKKYQPEWWNNLIYLNEKLKNLLSQNKEFDFTKQLKLQLLHSALLVSGKISKTTEMGPQHKILELKKIFTYLRKEQTFAGLKLPRHSVGLKSVLWMMKHQMAGIYLLSRKLLEI
ncbi:MAG TPA: hypothetical protein DCQ50_13490 [Chryseobacterium sp.]|nr:hypothetical protein [Chryseobacterium sp.]